MLENIRSIGIFMIIAQTVIHFAAGEKYEKYLKIISGVIVLLLFISPFVSSSEEITAGWQAQMAEMMKRLEQIDATGQYGNPSGISFGVKNVQETAQEKIEEQLRSRLDELVTDTDCRVTGVEIQLVESDGEGQEFSCVRVMMQDIGITETDEAVLKKDAGSPGKAEASVSDTDVIEKSAVRKIEIGEIRIGDETEAGQNVELKTGMQTDWEQEVEATGETGRRTEQEAEVTGETGRKTEQEVEAMRESMQGAEPEEMTEETKVQKYRRIFAQTLGIARDRVEVVYCGGW